jgi:hypothetical protein
MRYRSVLWILLSVFALSCTRAPLPSPPPSPVGTIAVLPPNNRTDDPLLVASDSFWDPYAPRAKPVTVADVLAAEARLQLERRGFTVTPVETVERALGTHTPGSPQEAADLAAQGKLEGNVLYIEIKRWEPDMPLHPQWVLVALEASLIEVATGRVMWTAHRALQPTPTPGAISRWVAYMIATRAVTEELLSPWGPEQPAS